jgi:nucleoside-diphosphate-sugar epimerase
MRVFVTGASGWIGSAVVPQLIESGHHVVGLARSDASAEAVAAAGAEVRRGDLQDLDSLRAGAADSDGVIHLAFVHDFSRFLASVETDLRAIEVMGAALERSDRPFVIASGTPAAAPGQVATERDMPDPSFPRSAAAELTLSLAERGVRSVVLRLPPSVHGAGDHGFIARLIDIARDTGVSGYVGEGTARWSAVHRVDAAALFRLALEKAPPGSVLHGVADEGIETRHIAEAIGRHLELPVKSIPEEEAPAHFGWMAPFFSAGRAASSALTREAMGWDPTRPGLVEDIDEGHYFEEQPTGAVHAAS